MPDTLPVHPVTGLRAVGIVAGRPVWPIMGASPDDPSNNDGDQGGDGGQEPPAEKQTPSEPTKVEELPLWAQKLISDTRNEAAKHRSDKNDAIAAAKADIEAQYKKQVEELSGQKSQLETDLEVAKLEALKLRVAMTAGIPASMADRLRGSTEDELKADAEEVKKSFVGTPYDPTQGAGGGGKADPGPGISRLRAAYAAD